MKFGKIDRFITGVSVPVAALRSRESVGVGEFADLPLLGGWCVKAGLGLIQILPVNDTGTNSSPYSALSAFALHPIYLRLQDIAGAGPLKREIQDFRTAAEKQARFSYPDVLSFKLSAARRLFEAEEQKLARDIPFNAWRAANPWVHAYAAFRTLKTRLSGAPWRTWGKLVPGGAPTVESAWESDPSQCLFFIWLQFQLSAQLAAASKSLEEMGVRLKGDIPILMSEESADVWHFTRYFDLSMRAGAPPDMYSADGQNWGFPIYDWKGLAADGYSWWKQRLREAAKFFHAFRIDHVLGFFRIWAIPDGEARATLGIFRPARLISREMLTDAGFGKGLRHMAFRAACETRGAGRPPGRGNAPRVGNVFRPRGRRGAFHAPDRIRFRTGDPCLGGARGGQGSPHCACTWTGP